MTYLGVRYPAVYAQTAEAHAGNASLSGVEVGASRLNGMRNIVDVASSYRKRETRGDGQGLVRVDVSEEFPFLLTEAVGKLSAY